MIAYSDCHDKRPYAIFEHTEWAFYSGKDDSKKKECFLMGAYCVISSTLYMLAYCIPALRKENPDLQIQYHCIDPWSKKIEPFNDESVAAYYEVLKEIEVLGYRCIGHFCNICTSKNSIFLYPFYDYNPLKMGHQNTPQFLS